MPIETFQNQSNFTSQLTAASVNVTTQLLSANVDVLDIISSSINNSSVYTTVGSNSANWTSSYTTVSVNSAKWSSAYSTVTANSANWTSSYTTVSANSANWTSSYTTVSPNSSKWSSAYSIVSANSATFIRPIFSTSTSFSLTFTTVSAITHEYTGTSSAIFSLPLVNTVFPGWGITIINKSTDNSDITICTGGAPILTTIYKDQSLTCICNKTTVESISSWDIINIYPDYWLTVKSTITQNVAENTLTKLVLSSATYGTLAPAWSNTSVFTVPISGIYEFSGIVKSTSSAINNAQIELSYIIDNNIPNAIPLTYTNVGLNQANDTINFSIPFLTTTVLSASQSVYFAILPDGGGDHPDNWPITSAQINITKK